MRTKKQPLSNEYIIDIDDFKLWARIDNDEEDILLDELIQTAINFFETNTNQVLQRTKFNLSLQNEKAFFPQCYDIKIISGSIEVQTEFNYTRFNGSGEVSFICGFDELPPIITLWIKNFALNLYENRVNNYKNDAVINFYKIKEF